MPLDHSSKPIYTIKILFLKPLMRRRVFPFLSLLVASWMSYPGNSQPLDQLYIEHQDAAEKRREYCLKVRSNLDKLQTYLQPGRWNPIGYLYVNKKGQLLGLSLDPRADGECYLSKKRNCASELSDPDDIYDVVGKEITWTDEDGVRIRCLIQDEDGNLVRYRRSGSYPVGRKLLGHQPGGYLYEVSP